MRLASIIIAAVFGFAAVHARAAVLYVGPNMPLSTPSAAAEVAEDGDTVEIEAAVYKGDVAVWRQSGLTLRGVGGRPHLIADGAAAEAKGIWVIKGNDTIVENIEFSDAVVEDKNGAGIRQEGNNLTIRRCYFHHNENGVLSGPNADSEILIEHSVFAHNGHGDGYSHNMYIGRVARFTLRFSYVHHARAGHQVKSRAKINAVLFNRLMDEETGTSSYLIDLPNEGDAQIIGNELQQGARAENWAMINSVQNTQIVNNTFVNDRAGGIFVQLGNDNGRSLLQNNLFVGRGELTRGPAKLVNNLVTQTPGFRRRLAGDYRLGDNSVAIDKGAAPASGIRVDAEYAHVAENGVRDVIGAMDVGAHEYVPVRTED